MQAGQTAQVRECQHFLSVRINFKGILIQGRDFGNMVLSPPSPPAAVPLAKATRRALGDECLFNRLGNAAGVVVMVPQRGQDPSGVHVLHLLVVLKGIAMDIG